MRISQGKGFRHPGMVGSASSKARAAWLVTLSLGLIGSACTDPDGARESEPDVAVESAERAITQRPPENPPVNAGACTNKVRRGNYTIRNARDLAGLAGYGKVTGNLTIWRTDLVSLVGLECLTEIGGFLKIQQNGRLTDLRALANLKAIGIYLDIQLNAGLTGLGLSGLSRLGCGNKGLLKIVHNQSLPQCLAEQWRDALRSLKWKGKDDIHHNGDGPCGECEEGPCCKDGQFSSPGEVCRPAAGECDEEEACSGNASECPTDQYAPPSTECRPATNICDRAESCTGASPDCPEDKVAPSATPCRASEGDCDEAEVCDGVSATCPEDALVEAGEICRAPVNACDAAEECDGASPICPPDNYDPSQVAESDPTCDGIDEDCDGATDDDFVATAITCGIGDCEANGETACVNGKPNDECTQGEPWVSCESEDAECGTIDDGCGTLLDCGTCESPETCGGAGIPNHCGSSELPPDPEDVAPPMDPTVSTTVFDSTSFLYEGDNPIQTGVEPGTIQPQRAGVVRGLVSTGTGAPLPGVTITVLTHPELGQTLTRIDGKFDMAVNGGGLLTFDYQKEGYLSVQRQVTVGWNDFTQAPDVVMIQVDAQVTTIDLNEAEEIQIAQANPMTDEDGTRQATMLFSPETTATMTLPDGTSVPLTSMNVRATEYTVGEEGPKAMPAALPPQSGYTYCVELSADEALAAGATDVQFDQPVAFYVDNFLGFPVGGIVPVGYYDRVRGVWIPSDNGRVIEILSITLGLAEVDSTGDGVADNDLNLSIEEQQKLATLYEPGQSLWRAEMTHFTPWDCNWPYGPPSGATAPKQPNPQPDKPKPDPCKDVQCVIQDQTIIQDITIPGTDFQLHYQSDRVPGYVAARQLNIPLTGSTLPPAMKKIRLEIDIAGQVTIREFEPLPNMTEPFTWDGKDAYDRAVNGLQPVKTKIEYVYDAEYQQPAEFEQSFAAYSGIPMSGKEPGRKSH